MVASIMLVLFILPKFPLPYNGFQLTGHYSNLKHIFGSMCLTQEGHSFLQTRVKKIITWSFNIFGTVVYWIKSVLKTMLKFEYMEVTYAISHSC